MKLLVASLAAISTVCAVGEALIISQYSAANVKRHAVETQEFACVDGAKLARGDHFSECTQIVWRYADEDGVK